MYPPSRMNPNGDEGMGVPLTEPRLGDAYPIPLVLWVPTPVDI